MQCCEQTMTKALSAANTGNRDTAYGLYDSKEVGIWWVARARPAKLQVQPGKPNDGTAKAQASSCLPHLTLHLACQVFLSHETTLLLLQKYYDDDNDDYHCDSATAIITATASATAAATTAATTASTTATIAAGRTTVAICLLAPRPPPPPPQPNKNNDDDQGCRSQKHQHQHQHHHALSTCLCSK